MKKIKNKYGVVNSVTDEKYDYLMGKNEGYEAVKPSRTRKPKEDKPEVKEGE